ncbi:MAG: late competence development ComFB family protein [Candidatus Goldiibacteriota bacterium]
MEEKDFIIKNYMEDIARRNLKEQIDKRDDICKCGRCQLDIYALALNSLPSKYVVTDKGHVFTKLNEMETQFNADVTREVYRAIEYIKEHKRHE